MCACSSTEACAQSLNQSGHVLWTDRSALQEDLKHNCTVICHSSSSITSRSVESLSTPSKASGHEEETEVDVHVQERVETGASGKTPAFKSIGSKLHAFGRCKPCVFIDKGHPCKSGTACPYCHESGDDVHSKQRRRGKNERMRLARILQNDGLPPADAPKERPARQRNLVQL